MDVEFDAGKDAANVAKHGVSLAFGAYLFVDADHLVLSAARLIDGEARQGAGACGRQAVDCDLRGAWYGDPVHFGQEEQ